MQIMKLTQKWVFDGQTRPNKIWNLKDQFGLKLGENRMGEREKNRRGRRRGDQAKGMELGFLVWKLTLFMNPMRLCMNFHALMVILLPKSRVFARVSSNPKNYENRVDKTPYGTR